jgi:predicted ATP-grasp superfamily ATP-dependent carboligase
MRVLLYEYACAQPPHADLPHSVRTEGRAMLATLMEDFSRIPGVDVLTMPCQPGGLERASFQAHAGQADWSVVIAPEFDGLLLERCRWVVEAGGRLLGPSLEIVELASDKWATYEFLARHGIRTPRTFRARSVSEVLAQEPLLARQAPGFVRKPRDGAGSLRIAMLGDGEAVAPGDLIQEFVAGVAASVAILAGPRQLLALLPAQQVLSQDGNFRYLGGRLPLPEPLAERARRLALSAVSVLPQPLGYLGVDLVLGAASDGSADYVIEINPRLTTSYVGLRAVTETNLAAAMLHVAAGDRVTVAWQDAQVEFTGNGDVQVSRSISRARSVPSTQ